MGIGQTPLRYYRYKIVDYLPYMYEHRYVLASGQPRVIVSYSTILDPFDIYVWGFTASMIIAEFVLLLVMQNLWSVVSEKLNPRDYIYQGFRLIKYFKLYFYHHTHFIADFLLSSEFIPRRRLNSWIQRKGFKIRKLLILKWIFLGNVITMAYKSTLLSSLITIRYEDKIDSLNDVETSGLPFLLHKNSDLEKMFANDQKQIMKNIYEKRQIYTSPRLAFKM